MPSAPPARFAVIVRNPRARRAPSVRRIWEGATPLRRAGWRIELIETEAAGDATRLAAQAAEAGASVVVACGGDGTVNEVLNGLSGRATALAVLPAGTANVWAREAHVPRDPRRALALLDEGRRVRVDVGRAAIGDGVVRRFLLMCGVGLDAEVVQSVEAHPRAKRVLRQGAFAWPAVCALARAHPVRMEVAADLDRATHETVLAVAGNTRLYGGVARLTGDARIDDGLLDLVLFEPAPLRWRALLHTSGLLADAMRGLGVPGREGVTYRQAARWRLTPETPLPVQLDGEYAGMCGPDAPLTIEAMPAAIEVVLGPGPNVLLGEAAAGR